jgi:glycosyltransferase involved in cell wall biosynthesis
LRYSLAAADAHLVSLVPGLSGLIEPSKAYGVIASGRPMLAAVDPESDAGRAVAAVRCGLLVKPANRGALVSAIRELQELGESERAQMGKRGRALAERRYARKVVTTSYRGLFSSLIAGKHHNRRAASGARGEM